MKSQPVLFAAVIVLGLAAMIVGVLAMVRRNSDLLPVAIGIFILTGIVAGIALLLQHKG